MGDRNEVVRELLNWIWILNDLVAVINRESLDVIVYDIGKLRLWHQGSRLPLANPRVLGHCFQALIGVVSTGL